jgi:hypothetical protein
MSYSDIDTEIAVLAEEADKLRHLAEDDPLKLPLGPLVDKINALRAEQAKSSLFELEKPAIEEPATAKKRGRPAKADE